jgi:RNA polymerase primary sigma factor
MGGGFGDTLRTVHILVATVQSACQYSLGLPSTGGLLVADEAHHYGAEVWSAALESGFDRRLGLTATYERDDDGVEKVLDPYFGSYRYSLGYSEALADDVIAHFKIAFVGVEFGHDELARYSEADEKARRKRSLLVNVYGLTPEPFGVFMREVQRLSKSGQDGAKQAGLYLSAFSKRRQILASADAKFQYLGDLAPAIKAADSTILFSQTTEAAERAVHVVEEAGISGETLHAQLDPSERQETFDAFRDGTNRFIAAPKLLDEGVDVPDADLAIVLASSRSRRQMIQRMGRVIRKKADGRLGRMVILYVEGTSEDPQQGAHENFVQFVLEAADDVQVFDSGRAPTEVVAYVNDW